MKNEKKNPNPKRQTPNAKKTNKQTNKQTKKERQTPIRVRNVPDEMFCVVCPRMLLLRRLPQPLLVVLDLLSG